MVWATAPFFLVLDSGPQPASAVVVLGGESWTRPTRAAEVFEEASPTWLIISGNGDCEDVRRQLEARNVPTNAILTECNSRSTKENADFSVKLLRDRGVTNAIIVTSWYHSRRAMACFQAAAPEITFYSRPSRRPLGFAAWQNPYERGRFTQECAKLAYYWVVHGVSPFL